MKEQQDTEIMASKNIIIDGLTTFIKFAGSSYNSPNIEFICHSLPAREQRWLHNQKSNVPKKYRGRYWEGEYSWWGVVSAYSHGESYYNTLMDLKAEYCKWLIAGIKNGEYDDSLT